MIYYSMHNMLYSYYLIEEMKSNFFAHFVWLAYFHDTLIGDSEPETCQKVDNIIISLEITKTMTNN